MTSPYLDLPLRDLPEAMADQRLRDAAPDLLAALEKLLFIGEYDLRHPSNCGPTKSGIIGEARAAIAKACQTED